MRYRDISIRKKILLSNFLMILIPTLFICSILIILLLGFSILTDNSSSLVRNVLLHSSNYGPTLLIKSINDELASSSNITDDAKQIFHKLEELNLRVLIKVEGEIMYITSPYKEEDIYQEFYQVAQSETYELPYIVWNQQGMAYATKLKIIEDKELTITFSGVGLALPKDNYSSWEKTKNMIKVVIILTGCCSILLILLLGIILTRKLSRYILQPLSLLQFATTEIKDGNLNNAITSTTHDEFGELCNNFEDMRKQLIASDSLQKQYATQRQELIAGISHDLSTPLTSIQGYVSGLIDGIADTPEKQMHYLDTIQSKTTLMTELVESLFLLSKLDMGEEPIHMKPTNLTTYMNDWLSREQLKYTERGLHLSFQSTGNQPIVMLDPLLFVRVLNNLCENSIKYRKGNLVNVEVQLHIQDTTCIVTFKDDGIGVTQEHINHLFERFYRVDPSRSSKVKGNGLGLSIARHIIEQMGGTIRADEHYHNGLCICISLTILQEVRNENNSNY